MVGTVHRNPRHISLSPIKNDHDTWPRFIISSDFTVTSTQICG